MSKYDNMPTQSQAIFSMSKQQIKDLSGFDVCECTQNISTVVPGSNNYLYLVLMK